MSSTLWSIAGSDSSGGAGIQADIKTAHNLGATVSTAITAVTAQNEQEIVAINPVSLDVLQSQLAAMEQQATARVIKLGLLANKEQVEFISQQLSRYKQTWVSPPFVIYDPVAIASNGGDLCEDDILPDIKEKLLPWVDLLTPNRQEMQKLTGVYPLSWNCLLLAAAKIQQLGVKSVFIKGGHLELSPDYSVDLCVEFDSESNKEYWLASTLLESTNSHGTGCTLSSAVAALLAQGFLLRDAVTVAKAYINQGLKKSNSDGYSSNAVWQGGWPENPADFPRVLVDNSSLALELEWKDDEVEFPEEFARSDVDELGLYPVVDSIEWLEKLLPLGIKTIQYREKQLTGEALEAAVIRAIKLGEKYQTRLFINDYWRLAIKHKAYGVHLGQEDLQSADLVQIQQAGLRLGISTHGYYELLMAAEYKPTYLAVGAIFPTKTKDMTGQIQGLETLKNLLPLQPNTPIVAIGGISMNRAPSVAETGVGGIAVVTAITEAANYVEAVSQLQQVVEGAK